MKTFGRLYLALIVLMPWALSTQLPPAHIRLLASITSVLPGSGQLSSVGSQLALEESIDLAIVLVSAVLWSVLIVSNAPSRLAIQRARARRPIRIRDRLLFLAFVLLTAFVWVEPSYVLNDRSGAAVGMLSTLIDTNALARGLFFAMLLLMAVFAALGFVFIVLGVHFNDENRGGA